jgi:hypothetical protein
MATVKWSPLVRGLERVVLYALLAHAGVTFEELRKCALLT